jgi:hypothetical protein
MFTHMFIFFKLVVGLVKQDFTTIVKLIVCNIIGKNYVTLRVLIVSITKSLAPI